MRLLAPLFGVRYDDLKQRHKERFLKTIIWMTSLLASFFLAFGSFSGWQYVQIQKQVDQTLEGQSLYLSSISTKLLEQGDRRTAMKLALEALPKDLKHYERPYVEEAEFALTQALCAYRISNAFMGDMIIHQEDTIRNVQISSDGKKVLTTTDSGKLCVWDTATGEQLNEIELGYAMYFQDNSRFSGNDKYIVSLKDGGIGVWDAGDGRLLWEVEDYMISTFELNAEDTLLACQWKGGVTIFDLESGSKVMSYQDPVLEDGFIKSLDFNSDSSFLAMIDENGVISMINIINQELQYAIDTNYPSVDKIVFSPDDERVLIEVNKEVYGDGDGCIQIRESSTGEVVLTQEMEETRVSLATFNPINSDQFAFTTYDMLYVFDMNLNDYILEVSQGDRMTAIHYSDDGSCILAASADGDMKIYVPEAGFEMEYLGVHQLEGINLMSIDKGVIATVAWHGSEVNLWKYIDSPFMTALGDQQSSIFGGQIAKDSRTSFTYSYDQPEIIFWDLKEKTKIGTISLETSNLLDVRYFNEDQMIAVYQENGQLTTYRTDNYEMVQTIATSDSLEGKISLMKYILIHDV